MLEWNINPVLVELGPLEVRYYGVLFSLGLLGAYYLARRMCLTKKLSIIHLDNLAVYLIVGLIVGARFGHIVFYELDYYMANPGQIIAVWNGGLASHGAAIGTIIAYLLFLWRYKIKPFAYADIIAIAATIPISLIRLGNFFNSEIVGRPTDAPWAVKFLRVDEIPRHPSQIYEFLMGFLILTILYPLWLHKNKNAKPGFFIGLFFVLYFSLRFLVEFFKEYPLHENFFNLTSGQILSLPFILLGAAILFHSRQHHVN